MNTKNEGQTDPNLSAPLLLTDTDYTPKSYPSISYDHIELFRQAMAEDGLYCHGQIIPGKISRFSGIEKSANNRAGWCLLLSDLNVGFYGDWSASLTKTWFANRWESLTTAEQKSLRDKRNEALSLAKKARNFEAKKAALRAKTIYSASTVLTSSPYTQKKHITPLGGRKYRQSIVLAIRNFNFEITSLQFIKDNGDKYLLSKGTKKGCFIHINGDLTAPNTVIICEGWATGCTISELKPDALVLAAIDAGNLKPVAINARCQWPSSELIIAADDDRQTPSNPGLTKATEASLSTNALLAAPNWPDGCPLHLSDFNDLAIWLNGGEA